MIAIGIMVIPIGLTLFKKGFLETKSTKDYLIVFITVIVGVVLIEVSASLIRSSCG